MSSFRLLWMPAALLALLVTSSQADDPKDLIVGPDKADPGSLFFVTLPADVPYSVEPTPKAMLPLRDEAGHRVLLIQGAEPPGYTFTIDHEVIHPTAAEIDAAPLDDAAALKLWLSNHAQDEIYHDSHTVKVGDGPDPDPPVPPDPPDPDPPGPAPIPVSGLHVLFVVETADLSKLSGSQLAILSGAEVRDYLNATCAKDDGTPGYRIFDKDVNLDAAAKVWQDAMGRPRKSLPWVIISNGSAGYEGPLPETPEAFLELCRKYEPED